MNFIKKTANKISDKARSIAIKAKSVIENTTAEVLSFVAQNERENIRKRQAEGIAAAKTRGVQFGRPEKPIPENFNELVKQWEKKQIDIDTVASMCDMAVSTFYKKLREQKLLGKLR